VSASLTTARSPAIGDVIADKYQLVRGLGRGATGEVWLARHKTLAEGVAIKLLTQALGTGGEDERLRATARFQLEARIAARLARKTQHIVRVTDHGDADGLAYLVMEFLDGMTLETKVSRGAALPSVEMQKLVRQVARALDCAHAEGVLHRDLKPSNLFLTSGEDGQMLVKILDFGIAQIMRSHATTGSFTADRGLIFGTPGFMSPEQALGHADLDGRCDLWALATIAYESLTNQLPVPGTTVNELIDAARSRRTIPLSRYRPDLPQSVAAFFDRAFAADIDARFATAAEFTQAFDDAFAAEPPQVEPPQEVGAQNTTPSVPPVTFTHDGTGLRAPRRSRLMTVALALVALVAAVGVGATWRPLSRNFRGLAYPSIALAAPQSPPATTPAMPPRPIDAPPVATRPLEAVPVTGPAAPIKTVTPGKRPHATSAATMASRVPADNRVATPLVAPSAQHGCDPPYVVDAATGKKHWALECL
jgi:serine/threonine protein kinase